MDKTKFGRKLMNGRCEVLDLLKQSKNVEVYRAALHQEPGTPDKPVVLKFIKTDASTATDEENKTAFISESKILSEIDHPCLGKPLACDTFEGLIYLMEDFFPGGSLAEIFRKLRKAGTWQPFSPLEVARLGWAVATGLAEAHAKGVSHKSVVPSNIHFRDVEHKLPVLVDFGMSRFTANDSADLLSMDLVNRSLAYLPPESFGYLKSDNHVASDLYSLGMTLYEMACGKPAFQSDDAKQLVAKIYTSVPDAIQESNKEFPALLNDIIQKLLRKSPNQRYSSATGLAKDLQRCVEALESRGSIPIFALAKHDSARELNTINKFVGRSQELETLRLAIHASKSKSEFFTIGAPSGTGKSRLASEVLDWATSANIQILSTKYSKFERNLPLSGIGRALRTHCDNIRRFDPSTMRKWRENLLIEIGEWGQLLERRLPFLTGVLPTFPKPPRNLQAEEEEQIFLELFAKLLLQLDPSEQGYVFFLDDLQWADDTSYRVLEQLASEITKGTTHGSAFFLGAYRSEEVPKDHSLNMLVLERLGQQRTLELGPLPRNESDELVSILLDEYEEDLSRLKTCTYEFTNGSPFHIYEYLHAALANRVFALNANGKWDFDEQKARKGTLNADVANLVVARLKKLGTPARLVLSTIATVTSSIDRDGLKRLLENKITRYGAEAEQWLDGASVSAEALAEIGLDELERERLMVVTPTRATFAHDKIREAAWQMIDTSDKTFLHTDYGNFLAQQCAEGGEKTESKDLFEASFHILSGDANAFPIISRQTLHHAGERAMLVFAYSKAKEYLQGAALLLPSSPEALVEKTEELEEWLAIHELYADALALSEQIHQAIAIYHNVLNWIKQPARRALIYSKICDNNLFLFKYQESLDAGRKGLAELNEPWTDSELLSVLGIPFGVLKILFLVFWWNVFGKRVKEITTKEDEIRWRLLVSVVVPTYFTKPLCATYNWVRPTCKIVPYKDNEYRAMAVAYWGTASGCVGLAKISRMLTQKAIRYFNAYPRPLRQLFLIFTSGYLLDFPRGELPLASRKNQQALQMAKDLGESFWRGLALQAVIHYDFLGIGNGASFWAAEELLSLQKKIHFEPNTTACCLRELIAQKRDAEAETLAQQAIESGKKSRELGFETIDVVYSVLDPGAYYLLKEDYTRAVPLLREAFLMSLKHLHRVAMCTYAPVLYAQACIRAKQPIRALLPLSLAWVNIPLAVWAFVPQTFAATGEFFAAIGLRRVALWLIETGIHYAARRGWRPVAAELRLALANTLLRDNPSRAMQELEAVREYFAGMNNQFFVDLANRKIAQAKEHYVKTYPLMAEVRESTSTSAAVARSLRQKIDTAAMLDMLAKLSVLSDLESLLDMVLDTFCTCTGADHAAAFIRKNDKWTVRRCRNVAMEPLLADDFVGAKINGEFLLAHASAGLAAPKYMTREEMNRTQWTSGAVMLVPLAHKGECDCIVYIGNRQIPELFTDDTSRIVGPLAVQAGIAIHNLYLMESREAQVRIEADLATAKAVQDAILPFAELPASLRISTHYRPAGQTGGDWYGYFYDDVDNVIFLFIGDATGHGIASALVAGLMCGAIYGTLFHEDHRTRRLAAKPSIQQSLHERVGAMVHACNACLYSTGARSNVLMTMFFAAIDVKTGKGVGISSGHTHPLHIKKSAENVESLVLPGTRLGSTPPAEHSVRSMDIEMRQGDVLFLYTDGLLENTGPSGKMLSFRALKKTLANTSNAEQVVKTVLTEADRIWQGAAPDDDVSLMAFQWNGPE